jgi:DNA-binding transcriptional LysR family regulator
LVAPDASAGTLLWEDQVVLGQAASFGRRADEPPLALFPEACVYRDAALTWLASSDRTRRIACETPSFHGLLAAVTEGYAVAPLAEGVVRRTPNLVQCTPPSAALGAYKVTLTRGSRQNAAASYLSEQLIEHCGQLGAQRTAFPTM